MISSKKAHDFAVRVEQDEEVVNDSSAKST